MELVAEKYKKTDIGLIPTDWDVVSLGDLFTFKNGLNKEKKFFGEGTPIVNYMDVYKYSGLTANDIVGKVTVNKQELKHYSVQKGDVFFTRTSETIEEIGVASVILEEVKDTVFSGFVLRSRPKSDLLEDNYKKYCFSTENARKEIISKASYTTRALTNGRLLSQVKIPLPPSKTEQIAIATALSDADNYISSLEKLIAKKRLIKQGAIQQLLAPKENWVEKKLGEICDVRDGTHDSPKYVKEGVLFVTSKNIIDGQINLTEISYITEQDAIKINQRSKVDRNDILMSMIGTIGNAVLVDFEPHFCIKNVALLKPKRIFPDFLIQLIRSNHFQKYLESRLDGGIQKFVSLGVLRELEISIPLQEQQKGIAEILRNMDKEISSLVKQLFKAQSIKQGMMQQLLTGKIRLV